MKSAKKLVQSQTLLIELEKVSKLSKEFEVRSKANEILLFYVKNSYITATMRKTAITLTEA